MNSENLVTMSNIAERPNNHVDKQRYSKAGTAKSIAVAIFVGATVLKSPLPGDLLSQNDFTRPSYVRYINLNQEKEFEIMHTTKSIDLMKVENINKIKKMELFCENWNGTGGSAFSKNSIAFFEAIIETLNIQPKIAPTGRNSLLMQYGLDDNSMLAFEVSENRTEKVYIPKGKYDLAQIEVFTENVAKQIKESVRLFYGLK